MKRKNIYIIPNLLTTMGLFCGFYAIVAAIQGRFEDAAIAVFVAMVMDGLDGRVARMMNQMSEFGAEYDSLVDMVSFGLAPAVIIFQWSLQHVEFANGKLGWIAAFLYVAAAAIRLARFNTLIEVQDKRFFQGLASPAAAAVLVGMVWSLEHSTGRASPLLMSLLTVIIAALMISPFAYYSFKQVNLQGRVPQFVMVIIILVLALLALSPAFWLVTGFGVYALSGPLLSGFLAYRRIRRRQLRQAKKQVASEGDA